MSNSSNLKAEERMYEFGMFNVLKLTIPHRYKGWEEDYNKGKNDTYLKKLNKELFKSDKFNHGKI